MTIKNVPELQFKADDGCEFPDWERKPLSDFMKESRIKGHSGDIANKITVKLWGRGVFEKNDKIEGSANTQYYIRKSGQFIYSKLDFLNCAFGVIPEYLDGYETTVDLPCFDITPSLNSKFVLEYIKRKPFYKQNGDTADGSRKAKRIHADTFLSFHIFLPCLEEQQKIAAFLTAVDNKLAALKRKHELLQTYKRGLMQKIFSQELRFKADDGSEFPEWELEPLENVFTRVKRKNAENNQNILTISAQQGLINQEDFFNKLVSAKDVTGYYLIHNGEFAYNKSYSKGYPMGAIKRLNKYDKGVVSTLYICFSINKGFCPEFYEQFLDNGGINNEIKKIAQEGARNHGLLNISIIEFFRDIVIPSPCFEEQQKIANFLSAIDKKITAVSQQIEQAEQFKQGLLQKMFI